MTTQIRFYTKSVYGMPTMYLSRETDAERTVANAIASLTGRKTLATSDMAALEVLGFTFTEMIATYER